MEPIVKPEAVVSPTPNPAPAPAATAAEQAAQAFRAGMALLPDTVSLSTQARKGLTRPPGSAAALVAQLLAMAQAQPNLCPVGLDLTALQSDLEQVTQLRQLLPTIVASASTVEDTILTSLDDAWHQGLNIYALAQAAARTQPELASELQPITNAMSTLRKKKKPVGTGKTGAGSGTTSTPVSATPPPATGSPPVAVAAMVNDRRNHARHHDRRQELKVS